MLSTANFVSGECCEGTSVMMPSRRQGALRCLCQAPFLCRLQFPASSARHGSHGVERLHEAFADSLDHDCAHMGPLADLFGSGSSVLGGGSTSPAPMALALCCPLVQDMLRVAGRTCWTAAVCCNYLRLSEATEAIAATTGRFSSGDGETFSSSFACV